jgi:glucoamylase
MRRRVLSRAILAVAVVALISGTALFERPRRDDAGSYSDGAALDATGQLQLLAANSDPQLLIGSRVLDPGADADPATIAAALDLAQQQRDWLASGWLPTGQYRELVSTALLDLHVLSTGGGTLAAMNQNWRYVWPRDSSFAAVAFATSGHLEDAVGALAFLQEVQAPDGSFEARYLPDGSGPPDDRLPQTDGTGWALWALDAVVAAAPPAQRAELLDRFEGLLQRSTAFLLAEVDNSRSLPSPSPDYWEHGEKLLTLGTAAPVLAGLEAASRLHDRAGNAEQATALATVAAEVRSSVELFFGSHSYGRYPGPSHADAASAFTLPPYQPTPLDGALPAWRSSVPSMLRPAGGIAPGAGWREINLSWTPETALYALAAAANGDHEQARLWLDWLAAHRTPIAALPEKVTADGDPSGPAPLAWTCALVVLTVAELER